MSMLMTTYSGRRVDLTDVQGDQIHVEDIAHSLSRICRFGGHTIGFYSVAQHCVRVARAVPSHLMLEGLLHDATEAYVGDMIRPLKRLLPSYKAIEKSVWQAIAFKYNLPLDMSPEVRAADEASLKAELMQVMNGSEELALDYWSTIEPLPAAPHIWGWAEAKAQYLLCFAEAVGIRSGLQLDMKGGVH